MASSSGVHLSVALDRLPGDAATAPLTAAERAAGGEDYGLAALVPPNDEAVFAAAGFVALGRAVATHAGGRVTWTDAGGEVRMDADPFRHFG